MKGYTYANNEIQVSLYLSSTIHSLNYISQYVSMENLNTFQQLTVLQIVCQTTTQVMRRIWTMLFLMYQITKRYYSCANKYITIWAFPRKQMTMRYSYNYHLYNIMLYRWNEHHHKQISVAVKHFFRRLSTIDKSSW